MLQDDTARCAHDRAWVSTSSVNNTLPTLSSRNSGSRDKRVPSLAPVATFHLDAVLLAR